MVELAHEKLMWSSGSLASARATIRNMAINYGVDMKKTSSIIVVLLVYVGILVLWAVHKEKVDLVHGLALMSALTTMAGTLWVMMGVWLPHNQIDALSLTHRSTKILKTMKNLFLDAHHQLILGLCALFIGFVGQVLPILAAFFHW